MKIFVSKKGEEMRTVSIHGLESQLQSKSLGSSRNNSVSTDTYGFDDYFKQSVQSRASNGNADKKVYSNDRRDELSNVNTKTEQVKQTDETDSTDTEDKTMVKKKNILDVEDVSQYLIQLNEAIGVLKQTLMNEFDVSEVEFTNVLEANNLTMVDLLDPNHLKQVFLELSGEDQSALLTNEMLQEKLQGLLELKDDLIPFTKDEVDTLLVEFEVLTDIDEDVSHMKSNVEQKVTLEDADTPEVTKTVTPNQASDESELDSSSSEEHMAKKEMSKEVRVTVNGQVEVSSQPKVNFMEQIGSTPMAREIVDQIVKEIKVNISTEQTSMELVLTPESLGKVNLTVTTKDGILTAHLVTETEVAKEAIESQMNVLKETLQNQGLKVESVEVTVATNHFDFMNQSQAHQQNQENPSHVKRTNQKLNMSDDDFIEEETLQTSPINVQESIGVGTNIDLTA